MEGKVKFILDIVQKEIQEGDNSCNHYSSLIVKILEDKKCYKFNPPCEAASSIIDNYLEEHEPEDEVIDIKNFFPY